MLKKKILGAKVLEANGYVSATRLLVPTDAEKYASESILLFNEGASTPTHQLGDIYNANYVDVIARAVANGDSALGGDITTERNERVEADESLGKRIDQEISDRKKAIDDLIDGAPEAYDTLKEISDYIAQDKDAGAAIINQIATEVSDRKAAVSDEQSRAEAAEKANADAIAEETSRAKDVEETLRDSVTAEANARSTADTELKNQLLASIAEAQTAVLAKAIVSMKSATYNKDLNTLTQVFVRGDGSEVSYDIDLSDIVDSNDVVNSESTTVSSENGKVSTSVNTLSESNVNDLFS